MAINSHGFGTFVQWSELLEYLDRHSTLYYQAPLDLTPTLVCVERRFKNGKLRIAAGPYSFTADPGHLDRFRYRATLTATEE